MFLDRVKIWLRAGDGGDGAATFRREAHVPRGGPDGGDGGRGGSAHLRVAPGQTPLRDFRFRHHFRATPGGRGEGSRRHGAAGRDLVLDVPPGTAIFDDETGALLADLVATGQSAVVARGCRGGGGAPDPRGAHASALLENPLLVAFNKLDLPRAADAWPAFRAARRRDGLPVVGIAAAGGHGG